MLVEGVEGVKYDELVEIEQANGEMRRGKVLEIDGDKALVQLFESSHGLQICQRQGALPRPRHGAGGCAGYAGPRFRRHGPVPSTAARPSFPKSAWISTARRMNPAARDYPGEFIQTGISAIDGLNTLVRGQKLPMFSGSGLPHAQLAAQIARQAKVRGTDEQVRRRVRRDRHHL